MNDDDDEEALNAKMADWSAIDPVPPPWGWPLSGCGCKTGGGL